MDEEFDRLRARIESSLRARDLPALDRQLAEQSPHSVARLLKRGPLSDRALIYRLLPREKALEVFDLLDWRIRAELFGGLRDEELQEAFEELDPDDRAQILDELPSEVAQKLMGGLSWQERALTAPILGYPKGSAGRYMSTEHVALQPQLTLGDALSHVRHHGHDAETVYTLPVIDPARMLLGVVGLRELLMGAPDTRVADVMMQARSWRANDDAEDAARGIVDAQLLAAPIVDDENRLLGILTIDDAARILEQAEAEDAARQGAAEPLRRPYLTAPVLGLLRARVVWLLVLAVSALLTVGVLDFFEATLEQVVTLALFIPLLTGTAGNTGAQAATTVTRALATGDVSTGDTFLVAWREVRVGALLGALLGVLGFALASIVFNPALGLVIGLTLFGICTLAATVGGVMPILAARLRADPAVFSTPFISTFCDATSLIIYFLVATWILQL